MKYIFLLLTSLLIISCTTYQKTYSTYDEVYDSYTPSVESSDVIEGQPVNIYFNVIDYDLWTYRYPNYRRYWFYNNYSYIYPYSNYSIYNNYNWFYTYPNYWSIEYSWNYYYWGPFNCNYYSNYWNNNWYYGNWHNTFYYSNQHIIIGRICIDQEVFQITIKFNIENRLLKVQNLNRSLINH